MNVSLLNGHHWTPSAMFDMYGLQSAIVNKITQRTVAKLCIV